MKAAIILVFLSVCLLGHSQSYQLGSVTKAELSDKQYPSDTSAVANDSNKIQLSFVLEVNTSIIPPEFYPALKNYYREMIEKQKEKIILKKI